MVRCHSILLAVALVLIGPVKLRNVPLIATFLFLLSSIWEKGGGRDLQSPVSDRHEHCHFLARFPSHCIRASVKTHPTRPFFLVSHIFAVLLCLMGWRGMWDGILKKQIKNTFFSESEKSVHPTQADSDRWFTNTHIAMVVILAELFTELQERHLKSHDEVGDINEVGNIHFFGGVGGGFCVMYDICFVFSPRPRIET